MQTWVCIGVGFYLFIAEWDILNGQEQRENLLFQKGGYDEGRLDFHRDINSEVKDHSIPLALVINVDQTPSSYVSVGKQTMSTKGSKSVPIQGLTDKRTSPSLSLLP